MDEVTQEKFIHIEERLNQHGERLNLHENELKIMNEGRIKSDAVMQALNDTLLRLETKIEDGVKAFKESLDGIKSGFTTKEELQLSRTEMESKLNLFAQASESKLNAQIVDGKWKGIVFGMAGCVISFIVIAFIGNLMP